MDISGKVSSWISHPIFLFYWEFHSLGCFWSGFLELSTKSVMLFNWSIPWIQLTRARLSGAWSFFFILGKLLWCMSLARNPTLVWSSQDCTLLDRKSQYNQTFLIKLSYTDWFTAFAVKKMSGFKGAHPINCRWILLLIWWMKCSIINSNVKTCHSRISTRLQWKLSSETPMLPQNCNMWNPLIFFGGYFMW